MADQAEIDTDARHRAGLRILLGRITIYYVVLASLVAAAIYLFPGVIDLLPFGGIAEYSPTDFVQGIQQQPSSSGADSLAWLFDATSLFLAMLTTLALMMPVSWLYRAIHEGHDYDHSIDETSLVMPAVVAGVVTVAQHSLALAFSLAGIVAGVRFRRALSDTFDTLFIFVAIGVGLAAGVAAIEIAVVITIFFNYATALICIFGDGLESKYVAEKEIARHRRKSKKSKHKLPIPSQGDPVALESQPAPEEQT